MDKSTLEKIASLIRYDIITSTTHAQSGHATSSLSAVELMTTLFFDSFFKYDLNNPHSLANDRFILSKGHATPLLYSLYHTAGAISAEELMTLRQFGSSLEGHPSAHFKYAEVATGSLGQGLSAGVGFALGLRLLGSEASKVYVLLGDSEIAEGQVWEAIQLAAHYKLSNLIGILDVNRLGQRGETMLGWDIEKYAARVGSFGWLTITVQDGHDLELVQTTLRLAKEKSDSGQKPVMIIAKTVKGRGISFLENKDDWHGKAIPKEKLGEALKELGEVDKNIRGEIAKPDAAPLPKQDKKTEAKLPIYKLGEEVATREAYGETITALGVSNSKIVSLDGEVSNSTMSDKFKKAHPDRFFEMFIAEQNMMSAASAMSKLGLVPFASSFAAFLTRAFDQIRMSQYAKANLKIVGSHAGVSIGEDGPSQMGLEDISMMRSIHGSTVFYPSDATSAAALTKLMSENEGMYYLRTNRPKTPVIYQNLNDFRVGGCNILKQSEKDTAVVIAAGVTLHEALKAYETLQKEGVSVAVIDLYCVKPIDAGTVSKLAEKTKHVIVVEDHYPEGGIGEAVLSALLNSELRIKNKEENSPFPIPHSPFKFTHLAVKRLPRSGKPEELLAYEEIDAAAIIKAVKPEANR